MIGIVRSDSTKEKLRIIKLKQLEKLEVSRTFNESACSFIDTFGLKHDFNFIHGKNGGEVMLGGYSVDGYDKNKNIIFEYDEPKHEYGNKKIKDLDRTTKLINKYGCKVLRYSERYNRFYWSYSDKSEIFI